jgi:hypothetical protein
MEDLPHKVDVTERATTNNAAGTPGTPGLVLDPEAFATQLREQLLPTMLSGKLSVDPAGIVQLIRASREELPALIGWLRVAFMTDEDLIILQGHTLIERHLPRCLNAYLASPWNFDDHLRDYAAQMRLSMHIGLLKSEEFRGYRKLLDLRNDLAHGKKIGVTVEDEQALRAAFDGSRFFRENLPSHKGPDSLPRSLKVILFTAWLFLEAKRLEAAKEKLAPVELTAETEASLKTTLAAVENVRFETLYSVAARSLALKSREFEIAIQRVLEFGLSDEFIRLLEEGHKRAAQAKPSDSDR